VPRVSIGSKELCDGSSNCGSLVESGLQDDLLVDNDNNDNNVVNLNLEFNEVGFALRVFDEMLVSGTVSMWWIMIMSVLFYIASYMCRGSSWWNH